MERGIVRHPGDGVLDWAFDTSANNVSTGLTGSVTVSAGTLTPVGADVPVGTVRKPGPASRRSTTFPDAAAQHERAVSRFRYERGAHRLGSHGQCRHADGGDGRHAERSGR